MIKSDEYSYMNGFSTYYLTIDNRPIGQNFYMKCWGTLVRAKGDADNELQNNFFSV